MSRSRFHKPRAKTTRQPGFGTLGKKTFVQEMTYRKPVPGFRRSASYRGNGVLANFGIKGGTSNLLIFVAALEFEVPKPLCLEMIRTSNSPH
jgi:hypothetical protein